MNNGKLFSLLLTVGAAVVVFVSLFYVLRKDDSENVSSRATPAAALHLFVSISSSEESNLRGGLGNAPVLDLRHKSGNYAAGSSQVTLVPGTVADLSGYTKFVHTLAQPVAAPSVLIDGKHVDAGLPEPVASATAFWWFDTPVLVLLTTAAKVPKHHHYFPNVTTTGIVWTKLELSPAGSALADDQLKAKLDELNGNLGNVALLDIGKTLDAATGSYTFGLNGNLVTIALARHTSSLSEFVKVQHKLPKGLPFKVGSFSFFGTELELAVPALPVTLVSVFWFHDFPLLVQVDHTSGEPTFFSFNVVTNSWKREPVLSSLRGKLNKLKASLGVPVTLDLSVKGERSLTYRSGKTVVTVVETQTDATGFKKFAHRFSTGAHFAIGYLYNGVHQAGIPSVRLFSASVYWWDTVPVLLKLTLSVADGNAGRNRYFSNDGSGVWTEKILADFGNSSANLLAELVAEQRKLASASPAFALDLGAKANYLTLGKVVSVAEYSGQLTAGFKGFVHTKSDAATFQLEKLGLNGSDLAVAPSDALKKAVAGVTVFWFYDLPLLAKVDRSGATSDAAASEYFAFDGVSGSWAKVAAGDLNVLLTNARNGLGGVTLDLGKFSGSYKTSFASVTVGEVSGSGDPPHGFSKLVHNLSLPLPLKKLKHFDVEFVLKEKAEKTAPVAGASGAAGEDGAKVPSSTTPKEPAPTTTKEPAPTTPEEPAPSAPPAVPEAQQSQAAGAAASSVAPKSAPKDELVDVAEGSLTVFDLTVYFFDNVPLLLKVQTAPGVYVHFKNLLDGGAWVKETVEVADVASKLGELRKALTSVVSLDVCKLPPTGDSLDYTLTPSAGASAVSVALAKDVESNFEGLTVFAHKFPQDSSVKLSNLTCNGRLLSGVPIDVVKTTRVYFSGNLPVMVQTNSTPKYYYTNGTGGLSRYTLPAEKISLAPAELSGILDDFKNNLGKIVVLKLESKVDYTVDGVSVSASAFNRHDGLVEVVHKLVTGAGSTFTVSDFAFGGASLPGLPAGLTLHSATVYFDGDKPLLFELKTPSENYLYYAYVYGFCVKDLVLDVPLEGDDLADKLAELKSGLDNVFSLDIDVHADKSFLALDVTDEFPAEDFSTFVYTPHDGKYPFMLKALTLGGEPLVVPDLLNFHLDKLSVFNLFDTPVLLHLHLFDGKSVYFKTKFNGSWELVALSANTDEGLEAKLIELKEEFTTFATLDVSKVVSYSADGKDVTVSAPADVQNAQTADGFKVFSHTLKSVTGNFKVAKVTYNGAGIGITPPAEEVKVVKVYTDGDSFPLLLELEVPHTVHPVAKVEQVPGPVSPGTSGSTESTVKANAVPSLQSAGPPHGGSTAVPNQPGAEAGVENNAGGLGDTRTQALGTSGASQGADSANPNPAQEHNDPAPPLAQPRAPLPAPEPTPKVVIKHLYFANNGLTWVDISSKDGVVLADLVVKLGELKAKFVNKFVFDLGNAFSYTEPKELPETPTEYFNVVFSESPEVLHGFSVSTHTLEKWIIPEVQVPSALPTVAGGEAETNGKALKTLVDALADEEAKKLVETFHEYLKALAALTESNKKYLEKEAENNKKETKDDLTKTAEHTTWINNTTSAFGKFAEFLTAADAIKSWDDFFGEFHATLERLQESVDLQKASSVSDVLLELEELKDPLEKKAFALVKGKLPEELAAIAAPGVEVAPKSVPAPVKAAKPVVDPSAPTPRDPKTVVFAKGFEFNRLGLVGLPLEEVVEFSVYWWNDKVPGLLHLHTGSHHKYYHNLGALDNTKWALFQSLEKPLEDDVLGSLLGNVKARFAPSVVIELGRTVSSGSWAKYLANGFPLRVVPFELSDIGFKAFAHISSSPENHLFGLSEVDFLGNKVFDGHSLGFVSAVSVFFSAEDVPLLVEVEYTRSKKGHTALKYAYFENKGSDGWKRHHLPRGMRVLSGPELKNKLEALNRLHTVFATLKFGVSFPEATADGAQSTSYTTGADGVTTVTVTKGKLTIDDTHFFKHAFGFSATPKPEQDLGNSGVSASDPAGPQQPPGPAQVSPQSDEQSLTSNLSDQDTANQGADTQAGGSRTSKTPSLFSFLTDVFVNVARTGVDIVDTTVVSTAEDAAIYAAGALGLAEKPGDCPHQALRLEHDGKFLGFVHVGKNVSSASLYGHGDLPLLLEVAGIGIKNGRFFSGYFYLNNNPDGHWTLFTHGDHNKITTSLLNEKLLELKALFDSIGVLDVASKSVVNFEGRVKLFDLVHQPDALVPEGFEKYTLEATIKSPGVKLTKLLFNGLEVTPLPLMRFNKLHVYSDAEHYLPLFLEFLHVHTPVDDKEVVTAYYTHITPSGNWVALGPFDKQLDEVLVLAKLKTLKLKLGDVVALDLGKKGGSYFAPSEITVLAEDLSESHGFAKFVHKATSDGPFTVGLFAYNGAVVPHLPLAKVTSVAVYFKDDLTPVLVDLVHGSAHRFYAVDAHGLWWEDFVLPADIRGALNLLADEQAKVSGLAKLSLKLDLVTGFLPEFKSVEGSEKPAPSDRRDAFQYTYGSSGKSVLVTVRNGFFSVFDETVHKLYGGESGFKLVGLKYLGKEYRLDGKDHVAHSASVFSFHGVPLLLKLVLPSGLGVHFVYDPDRDVWVHLASVVHLEQKLDELALTHFGVLPLDLARRSDYVSLGKDVKVTKVNDHLPNGYEKFVHTLPKVVEDKARTLIEESPFKLGNLRLFGVDLDFGSLPLHTRVFAVSAFFLNGFDKPLLLHLKTHASGVGSESAPVEHPGLYFAAGPDGSISKVIVANKTALWIKLEEIRSTFADWLVLDIDRTTGVKEVVEYFDNGYPFTLKKFVAPSDADAASKFPAEGFVLHLHKLSGEGFTPFKLDKLSFAGHNLQFVDFSHEGPLHAHSLSVYSVAGSNTPLLLGLFVPTAKDGAKVPGYKVFAFVDGKWHVDASFDEFVLPMAVAEGVHVAEVVEDLNKKFLDHLGNRLNTLKNGLSSPFLLDLAKVNTYTSGATTVTVSVVKTEELNLKKVSFVPSLTTGGSSADKFTLEKVLFGDEEVLGFVFPLADVKSLHLFSLLSRNFRAGLPLVLEVELGSEKLEYHYYLYGGDNIWKLQLKTFIKLELGEVLDLVGGRLYGFDRAEHFFLSGLALDFGTKFTHLSSGKLLEVTKYLPAANNAVPKDFVLYKYHMTSSSTAFQLRSFGLDGQVYPYSNPLLNFALFVYYKVGVNVPLAFVLFQESESDEFGEDIIWYSFVGGRFSVLSLPLSPESPHSSPDPLDLASKEKIAKTLAELAEGGPIAPHNDLRVGIPALPGSLKNPLKPFVQLFATVNLEPREGTYNVSGHQSKGNDLEQLKFTVGSKSFSDAPGFLEFQQTIAGVDHFTVADFEYNGQPISGIGAYVPMDAVKVVSTICWSHPGRLDGLKGRPLLVKVTAQVPGVQSTTERYYENIGAGTTDNTKWRFWKDNASQSELQKKLHLLNCRLNDAVVIDITRRVGPYDACNGNSESSEARMTVSKDTPESKFENYEVYAHSLNNGGEGPFNVVGFKNENSDIILPRVGPTTDGPILSVDQVKVYFYSRDPTTPLLMYIKTSDPKLGSKKWWKSNDGKNWEKVVSLAASTEKDYDKIREVLDTIERSRKLPEVTIDIHKRFIIGLSTNYPSNSNLVEVINNTNTTQGFAGYTHKVQGKRCFTVNGFKYNEEEAKTFLTPMKYIKEVSVFYWIYLEPPYKLKDQRGRPLLVKVTKMDGSIDWYENTGTTGDLVWRNATGVYDQNLEANLKLLNSSLNRAVIVDVGMDPYPIISMKYDACERNTLYPPNGIQKMQVSKDPTSDGENPLGKYKVYTHTLSNGSEPFHVLSFKNGLHEVSTGHTSHLSPILDVTEVKVYMCGNKPLLVYIDSNDPKLGSKKWWQSKDGKTWEKVGSQPSSPQSHKEILEVLNTLGSNCS
ncbi:hypothetical protein BEWA_025280 [Theileria equi strain WA]|uniref:Uncharacterized protein n=1 Tax=Theileria equi strain WA TaxID=1537102 RepID=L0AXP3_THEEQ|nr:hypothetical protein BEWA_025280 [Theileria equi strain WA]AFZ79679.1 hypothetical protein BEWA_025280 [Theileria equi strain WA]|eukprot:XP_004829345.1 hypothetical protein BEWA_025280 [Theileria equi strain WA]